jgi:hypothetical protein
MAIGEDKDRIIVTVDKELKVELEKLAKEEKRNLSNYCYNVLSNHYKQLKKDK